MARSAREIAASLGQSVQATDSSTDLGKGPIFDLLIAPVAPELAATEQVAEDLRTLASLQLDRVVTLQEITAIGTSFGLPQIDGLPATVNQTFYCETRPSSDISIKRGTLVGTTDGSRIFQVVENVTMLAQYIDQYYVASRRRFEINAKCQAVAIGTAANLPAYRITKMFSQVAGIDGSENREISQGGTDQQSFSQYLNRIRQRFLGQSPETGGGLLTKVFEYAPNTITDVSLVYPKDRTIFSRDTGRPAIDCYIIGTALSSATQQFVASGGEQTITLEKPPVDSVTSVQIDGASTSGYALVKDQSRKLAGSARATDKLVLTAPLLANQVVDISYQYDATVSGLQADGFDTKLEQFGTDILVRLPVVVPVSVTVDVTCLASFDVNRVTDLVKSKLFSYVEAKVFINSLLPEVFVQAVLNDISGVSSCRLTRFAPTNKAALAVEAITLQKNEVSQVDQANLNIRTHQ